MCETCGCQEGEGAVATAPRATATATRDAPDRALVLKRNNVERLKNEKFPLKIIEEIPELAQRNYLDISEEDMVRFQWYGLYQDKPKVGYFMLRIKVPSGILTPAQYRTIGELSQRFGRNYTELSTRQNVQIHWIEIKQLPEVFAAMERVGLTSVGGCGDTVRNVTGCPVAGLDAEEAFDCRPQLDEVVKYFLTHVEYFDLPRKHKITISTCAYQCNAPEINCISFIGARQPGPDGERLGFSVRVGGGLSSTPRIARDLGIFVEPDDVLPTARAILDVWREDPKYRLSRAKARLKFLVDDYGVDGVRSAVEERLGRRLEDIVEAPKPLGHSNHLGIHRQKQEGLYYVGFPVFIGQVTGEQTVQIADLAESYGGDIRLTRQQNFILTGIPEARLDEVIARVAEIGFSLNDFGLRGASVACTGQPLCNFAVAGTKPKLQEITLRLEERFGEQVSGLKLGVDGCPHACAHHWISDIGLQGTTGRGEADGGKIEAYEIYLRGGLGENAAIGRPLLRRIPAEQAPAYVERLVGAYLEERGEGESFQSFAQRKSDEELIGIAHGQTAGGSGQELALEAAG
ncbi:MAG TPA: nitrite/sulfite reductase [Chloroflexota bacterium]|nr:nitrite/sulfite reductase [Chloroflexota bacterium]